MLHYLNILPDFKNNWDMAVAVFVMPIAVQWWATWYPGAEPGGGSYIAQRMLASKSEKDSLGAVLFFNVAHYVLRPWPWILVGLCSLLVYPQLSDIQKAFPNLDPKLLGHDIAYPAMLKFLPVGFHRPDGRRADRRQLLDDPDAPELGSVLPGARLLPALRAQGRHRETLRARWAAWRRSACSSAPAGWSICWTRPRSAFDIMLQVGAGTGLLYLLRWFWWRINAWCEVVAMVSSFGISLVLLILKTQFGMEFTTHYALLTTIAVTTRLLGADGLPRPPDRPPDADRVLQEGPPLRPRLAADPRRKRASRKRKRQPRTRTFPWRCSAGRRAAR